MKFKKQAKEIHGNKYDYSKVNYINNSTKIIIICPKHGEFKQTPRAHLSGQKCRKCVNDSKKLTFEEFKKRANKIHNNKYSYLNSIFDNISKEIIITCPIHGNFKQSPKNHLRGSECRDCANNKLTRDQFIKYSTKIHGSKYDYSKVNYVSSKTKIIITCLIHGEFYQQPALHLSGSGCKKCGNERSSKKQQFTLKEFIKKSKETHGNKYDYSKSIYNGIFKDVIIICPIHGDFLQRPNKHIHGHGCPDCGGSKKLTLEEFTKRANKIHNNKYDYSKSIYINYNSKIIIICPIHGKFLQTPDCHLHNQGCPNCVSIISKASQDWLDSLNIDKNMREKTIKINNRKFIVDGYSPKTNTVYEFYGDFWHGNPKIYNENDINPRAKKTYGELYNRTIEKENILKSVGYNLITIWESEWNECKITNI